MPSDQASYLRSQTPVCRSLAESSASVREKARNLLSKKLVAGVIAEAQCAVHLSPSNGMSVANMICLLGFNSSRRRGYLTNGFSAMRAVKYNDE